MKIFSSVVCFLLLFLFIPFAKADDAQRENPLYSEAKSLWQQLSDSKLSTDKKAVYGKWFGDLANEQRQLWDLAGQVDSGTCVDECLSSYNSRVIAWQNKLQAFSKAAHTELESPGLPMPGIWKTVGAFTHGNLGVCRQTWGCFPNQQVMHGSDTKIVATPSQTLTGFCSTRDNPESCEFCSASTSPPKENCEWHLESA